VNTPLVSPRALALAATVVLWASAFPAIRVGVPGLGVAGLSVARLVVASAALALVAPLLGVRRPHRRDLPRIALCGATGMSAYQLLLNWGEVHVAAGTASLLISVAPVFSVLLAAAFLGERVTARIVVGSLIALAGAALVALGGGSAQVSTSALVVIAAAVVQGVYHFGSKPLLRHYTGFEVACYAMWSGTLFLLPLAPAAWHTTAHAATQAGAPALASAVYLGVAPSALGFVTWGYAVARYPVALSTAALYLVPPVTLGVAFVWLGERPRPLEMLGGLVGIGGVVLMRATATAGRIFLWRSSRGVSRAVGGPRTIGCLPASTRPGTSPSSRPGRRRGSTATRGGSASSPRAASSGTGPGRS
jgi:drug/metabolite transporter (DMT)-like permease